MASPSLFSIKQVVKDFGDEIVDRATRITERYGISTGYKNLDDFLRGGGLLPGLTYMVAGRPGMGKTTLLQNIAINMAKDGVPVAMFSLELSRARLLERLTYQACGIDYMEHWRKKQPLTEAQIQKIERTLHDEFAPLPLYIKDTAGMTPTDIRDAMQQHKDEFGLKVMFIDYLHIMRNAEKVYGGGREREIGTMVETIRDTAKSLGVACVLACQLNRSVEEAPPFIPALSHLRDSGSIEQVAYAVLAVYRQDYYAAKGMLNDEDGQPAKLNGELSVLVLKQQDGPMGTATLKFEEGTGKIKDK